MNNTVLLVIFCVIVAWALLVFIMNLRKRKWYKLYMANGDVECAYKMPKDYWFHGVKDMIAFRLASGRLMYVTRRWIIKAEELEEEEVPGVQQQIQELKEKQESEGDA